MRAELLLKFVKQTQAFTLELFRDLVPQTGNTLNDHTCQFSFAAPIGHQQPESAPAERRFDQVTR